MKMTFSSRIHIILLNRNTMKDEREKKPMEIPLVFPQKMPKEVPIIEPKKAPIVDPKAELGKN